MFQIENAVKFVSNLPSMAKSISEVLGKVTDPKSRDSLNSMLSPPTMLNKSISSERSFAGTTISLSRAKALATKYDLTYLVIDRDIDLPLAYRNTRFRVYALKNE